MTSPQLHRPLIHEWLITSISLIGLVGVLSFQQVFWRMDNLFYDAALKLWQRPAPDDVVIAAIDDESLTALGRWPWPRAIHAQLLDILTRDGVRAVGFDIILSEADTSHPGDDARLAAAIRRNKHVVLPVFQSVLASGTLADGLPLPAFAEAAAALGHVQSELDADGIMRSVYLHEGMGTPNYPHLSLALLDIAQPGTISTLPGERAPSFITGTADWARDYWIHIPFAGPPGHFRHIAYSDIIQHKFPPGFFRNKVVFIGATATGMGDIQSTPVSGLNRPMSGVEINANIYDALRSHLTINLLPVWANAGITMISLGILLFALLRLPARHGLWLSLLAAIGSVAIAAAMLRFSLLWFAPSALLLGIVLAYPVWSWRRLETTQRYLDTELASMANELVHAAATPENALDPIARRIQLATRTKAALKQAQQNRDDLMQFISHDIRAPLASILALLQHPGDTNPGEQIKRYATGALDLADDFFRLIRAESLDPKRFTECDLVSMLEETADDTWALAQAKRITVTREFSGIDEAWIQAARTQFQRACFNLLTNAVKYSPPDTGIILRLMQDDDSWIIQVEDHGYGIAAEALPRLFTRYQRLRTPEQPETEGVGLGLIISKTVIERHHGEITVTSAPGSGTTFTITLPKAQH
ncbi:MAG: CHASE2 and HATPase_c domain-containing protein [Sulfuriferula sp.]|nr:CHASE2 and HATPase_c domain-containing protein [Sulfuriferula sp.]